MQGSSPAANDTALVMPLVSTSSAGPATCREFGELLQHPPTGSNS